jgi:hypothetical protein
MLPNQFKCTFTSKEQSHKAQIALFTKGYFWGSGDDIIRHFTHIQVKDREIWSYAIHGDSFPTIQPSQILGNLKLRRKRI